MDIKAQYQEQGFVRLANFFSANELNVIKPVVKRFHQSWTAANQSFYQARAINSAYLTGNKHLTEAQRNTFFQWLSSKKLSSIVSDILGEKACFLNTQLFFNPVNPEQKNYWHRDPQYHLSLEEQKLALSGPDVVHIRIPLADEPGIELVPKSHRKWDTQRQLDVRLSQNGATPSDELDEGQTIALNTGDVLVFSGLMIHRGLYGKQRLALDVLYCDEAPDIVMHCEQDCLPSNAQLAIMQEPFPFANTLAIKSMGC
ncbi:phytanoyl-CoA dioxygenase family protein [Thalassotalea euphylliae]|uniref:phytanoyl-CoA dioxygenase family protein n=1 Tax=Thalassotalea euphylliae TaxID=1655234 RepID=UPI00362CA60A